MVLAKSNNLSQEISDQYIASFSYDNHGISLKTEFYYKKYSNLHLWKDNEYTSNGFGDSKGFDVYFRMIRISKISNIHFHTLTMILKDCMKDILKPQRHLLHQSIISG